MTSRDRVRSTAIRAVGLVAVIVAALLISQATRVATPPAPTSSPSASPTEIASPTATAAATSTTAPTASPSPSLGVQSNYMSKALGYALTLTPPWHKAICGNSDVDWPGDNETESLTNAAPEDEFFGHTGSSNDRIEVALLGNPEGRTMLEIARAFSSPSSVQEVTFAGRPAVEVSVSGGNEALYYFIAAGDRYYQVGYRTYRPSSAPAPDVQLMQQILRSFRFLSQAEREALPDPPPIPATAPTAEALARALKTAFEQKDVPALERLLGPCINTGAEESGGSLMAREGYVADLRKQFAAGLTVTVDAGRITPGTWRPGDTFVRSQWNAEPAGQVDPAPSPDAQIRQVELMLTPTSGGFYWRGTMRLQPER